MGDKVKPLAAYRRRLCCLWAGNLGCKKNLRGAEQPFGTIVDGHAPGDAPQPLTLNHPASNPGCSSGWGSSFSGHRIAAKMIPGLS